MGSFVSIRGWIECAPATAPSVAEAIRARAARGEAYSPPPELASEYMRGWRFPERTFNWTAFLFFGADIRDQYADWFVECLVRAAAADPECEGWFQVDGDHVSCWWRVQNGAVTERPARE